MEKARERTANALKQELVVRVEATSRASAGAVYAVLADLSSHVVWAGERQGKRTRLLTIDAPTGPAVVGTEFHSTGADPMGRFSDRSVVTEATPGEVFEFVTEARLTTKKGIVSDWTNVERYELEPAPDGCRIVSTSRVTRISRLPGMLGLFNVRGLRALGLAVSAKVSRRSVRNLARMAEELAGKEVRRMRKVRSGFVAGLLVTLMHAVPANAASPTASCPGQELSAIAPLFRSELGSFVSFEAQNPELEGWRNFGAEIGAFAHAERADCPEE